VGRAESESIVPGVAEGVLSARGVRRRGRGVRSGTGVADAVDASPGAAVGVTIGAVELVESAEGVTVRRAIGVREDVPAGVGAGVGSWESATAAIAAESAAAPMKNLYFMTSPAWQLQRPCHTLGRWLNRNQACFGAYGP
jgi:hypothetical protein